MTLDDASLARSRRERDAANDGRVYERNAELRSRFSHVHSCPNTQYAEMRNQRLVAEAVVAKSVLDVGCGDGHVGRGLLKLGAARVHGVDISESRIVAARGFAAGDPRLTYETADVACLSDGVFDVIVGAAVLHHLDWRSAVAHLYEHALSPGGSMFFSEPMGSMLALKLYWHFFPNAHTRDERPFMRADIRWLRERFSSFELYATNYFSFYAGIVSSFVFSRSDNALMQASDKLDRALERIPWMQPAFRYGLFVVRKPGRMD